MIKLHNNYNITYDFNASNNTGNIYSNQNWNLFYNKDMSNFANGCSNLNFNLDKGLKFIKDPSNPSPSTYVNINYQYVQNMSRMFYKCNNLFGSPICGNRVINMSDAYFNCFNISGNPICGTLVEDFSGAYSCCNNLTGDPVCGPNVTNMSRTYEGCIGLTTNAACGQNVINMSNAYNGCTGLLGSPACGYSVINMSNAYNGCLSMTGAPICGPLVQNLSNTYRNCKMLSGSPVCGDNVATMAYSYVSCENLMGSPVCGINVSNMDSAYAGCKNLMGSPVCGDNVECFSNAYYQCPTLTGTASIGEKVTNAYQAYWGCKNLTNIAPTMRTVSNIVAMYSNCFNISGETLWYTTGDYNAYKCFDMHNNDYKIVMYIKRKSQFDSDLTNYYTDSTQFKESIDLFNESVRYTKIPQNHGFKNTVYNIYIYNNLGWTETVYQVPRQLGSVEYTGSDIHPQWEDFISSAQTVTGDSGIDAGTYTATFSLNDKNNCVWLVGDDYIIEDQQVTWNISKGGCILTLSSTEKTQIFDEEYTDIQYSLTSISDPLLTYSIVCETKLSDDNWGVTSLIRAEVTSLGVLRVYYDTPGNYRVRFKANATNNYRESNEEILLINIPVHEVEVPSQLGTVSFTGESLLPTWGWNPWVLQNFEIVYEDASNRILPGSHQAIFTPKEVTEGSGVYRYVWADGSAESKTVYWTIIRANSNGIKAIASIYNDSRTYQVGELVVNQNVLYECTVAITTPEVFNPSHWRTYTRAVDTITVELNDLFNETTLFIVRNTSEIWDSDFHGELKCATTDDAIAHFEKIDDTHIRVSSDAGGAAILDIWYDEGTCYNSSNHVTCNVSSSSEVRVILNYFSENGSLNMINQFVIEEM